VQAPPVSGGAGFPGRLKVTTMLRRRSQVILIRGTGAGYEKLLMKGWERDLLDHLVWLTLM